MKLKIVRKKTDNDALHFKLNRRDDCLLRRLNLKIF